MKIRNIFILLILFGFSAISSSDEILKKASNLILNMRTEEAILELENGILRNPNNIFYYQYLSEILIENDDLERANIYIDRGLKLKQNDEILLINKSEYLRRTGKLSDAKKIISKLERTVYARTNVNFNLYKIRVISEENELKAIEDLKRLISLYPSEYRYQLDIAELFLRKNSVEEAKKHLDNAFKINRFNKKIYSLYGEYFGRVKDYKKGIENLEKAILFPGSKEHLYYLLSYFYYELGNYKKSLEYSNLANLNNVSKLKIMFEGKMFEEIINQFRPDETQNEIELLFLEESSINQDKFLSKNYRKELSENRVEYVKKHALNKPTHIEFGYRRAIRLSPRNTSGWYELGNLYKNIYSQYTSYFELLKAKDIVSSDEKLENLFLGLENYISNQSKLKEWLGKPILGNNITAVDFYIVKNHDLKIDRKFAENISEWVVSFLRVPWVEINVKTIQTPDTFTIKSSKGIPIILSYSVFGEFIKMDLKMFSRKTLKEITNFSISSQLLRDDVVSFLMNSLKNILVLYFQNYGTYIGEVSENRFVFKVLKYNVRVGTKVDIVSIKNFEDVLQSDYDFIASGTVRDSDGEFVLIELDQNFRYITKINKDYICILK